MPPRLSATFDMLNLDRYDLQLLDEGELFELERLLRQRAADLDNLERRQALLDRAERALPY